MRRVRKAVASVLVLVFCLAMGMTAFAADNYKSQILAQMDAAAAELGVQNSQQYQNARASVAAYEGTISKTQYDAAIAEIGNVEKLVEAYRNGTLEGVTTPAELESRILGSVTSAAKAVGITISYDENGKAHVVEPGSPSNPVKQTGMNYTMTVMAVLAVLAAFGGCAAVASRKNLFA